MKTREIRLDDSAEIAERSKGTEAAAEKLKIAVVDAQPCFARGLALLVAGFDANVEVTGVGSDIHTALGHAGRDVDILLVDPPQDVRPHDLVREIWALAAAARIVFFTADLSQRDVNAAMSAGISGYVYKELAIDDLLRVLYLVKAGQVVVSPLVLQTLLDEEVRQLALTDEERTLLMHLAEGLDNEEIAGRMLMSLATAKRGLEKVMRKLAVDNRVQAAVTAVRRGII